MTAHATTTSALIRNYYDAFNARDIDTMLTLVADDVIHDINQGERRTGKSRFHAFCARMEHHYRETLSGIEIFVSADGTRAAAEFNVSGTYLQTEPGLPPANGETYQLPAGTFFAVRDGKITRITTYYNLTDWIMQVTGGSLGEPGPVATGA
ncbi:MAG TPA: ketosteroid isomerase-related protein [Hyphomicrobiaceae bacterium]|nr:ketosteroid isomerase-related protein [Hyphomicrobiaceae bacterium]